MAEKLETMNLLFTFRKERDEHPMRVFDPFAGVGAFALGLCRVGGMKFTSAIELDSSAASAIRYLNRLTRIIAANCDPLQEEQQKNDCL